MTRPRCVLPDTTYLITRRCTQRMFLLRPSEQTNELIGYAFAVAMERTQVQLHSLCVMSTHYHAVATDTEARLPEFWREAHRLIAKSVNALRKRSENLWSTTAPSGVELTGDETIIEKMVYTLTNPVEAGLVSHSIEWPGLLMTWGDPPMVFRRPEKFYSKDSSLPEVATLKMVRPPCFSELNDEETRELVRDRVEEREQSVRTRFRKERRRFLGAAAVLATRPLSKPKTRAPKGELNPRVAASNKLERIEALERQRVFVDSYKTARVLWCSGVSNVVFPAGTYYLRVHAGVRTG